MTVRPPTRGLGWFVSVACLVASPLFMPETGAQPVRIADEVSEVAESAHPYPAGDPAGQVVWTRSFSWPDASYIAVHFDRLELGPGDSLVLADPEGRYRHVYTGRGYKDLGGGFWGLSILGSAMQVTLVSAGPDAGYGVRIDRWAHGYPLQDLAGGESLCGTEDFKDVECYRETYPAEYEHARAVVRLIKNGSAHCTGWLASCENHIITNQHCVASQAELDQIEFQFEYKRPNCNSGAAAVELQLHGGTLLEANQPRDYAFIKPDLAGNDPQAVYGYLQWDAFRLPDIDEVMYVVNHPSGDPKRLSLESTDSHDQSGRCEVFSTNEPACQSGGPPDVGYYCDTEGGSSGSPVLSAVSQRVIALHHCAACPNRGVPIREVYQHLQASAHPVPACSTCQPPNAASDLVAVSPADNQIRLDWQAPADATSYNVYRSSSSCDDGFQLVGSSSTPTYLDETIAGGLTYHYRVRALSACGAESPASNCATQVASGECTEPPRFDGVVSADSARQPACGIDVSWAAALPRCGNAVYNVYRSVVPQFAPTPANLVATCVAGLSWRDATVLPGETYHYIVRAEDDSGSGGGPCAGGNEERNAIVRSATPAGPDNVFARHGMEPDDRGWTLTGEWQIAPPQGKGGSAGGGMGASDPTAAAVGLYVLGHDISGRGSAPGNYENNLVSPQSALSPTIDTRGHSQVRLRFRRWLGTDRAPGDRAFVDVFDGASYTEIWSNPTTGALLDNAWTVVDLDVTPWLKQKAAARVRFSQSSNASGTACGWNVDELEIYEPTSCSGGAVAVPPVPDGRFAPGTPMTAARVDAAQVRVRWDVQHCASTAYNLFYGDSAGLPGYAYDGALCALPSGGDATLAIPLPAPGQATWWVVAGASGATEGTHGYTSGGGVRPAGAAGLCGISAQSLAAGCH